MKTTSNLPHKVGSAEVASPELKKVVMQFMENFNVLNRRVAELERKVSQQNNGG